MRCSSDRVHFHGSNIFSQYPTRLCGDAGPLFPQNISVDEASSHVPSHSSKVAAICHQRLWSLITTEGPPRLPSQIIFISGSMGIQMSCLRQVGWVKPPG